MRRAHSASVPVWHAGQALQATLGMVLALALFLAVERMVVPHYRFDTPLDHAIPFLPLTWAVYVLFFPLLVAASARAPAGAFQLLKASVVPAFFVSLVCFHLFPETVPRPDPATVANAFLRQRLVRLWALDLASNGAPSLHVSMTCLACRMLWHSRYRWLVAGAGVLICLSTLTVKQHTVVDVAGGVAVALLCGWLASAWQRRGAQHEHA
jgi:membrane-associated phospholipid phosphatase